MSLFKISWDLHASQFKNWWMNATLLLKNKLYCLSLLKRKKQQYKQFGSHTISPKILRTLKKLWELSYLYNQRQTQTNEMTSFQKTLQMCGRMRMVSLNLILRKTIKMKLIISSKFSSTESLKDFVLTLRFLLQMLQNSIN